MTDTTATTVTEFDTDIDIDTAIYTIELDKLIKNPIPGLTARLNNVTCVVSDIYTNIKKCVDNYDYEHVIYTSQATVTNDIKDHFETYGYCVNIKTKITVSWAEAQLDKPDDIIDDALGKLVSNTITAVSMKMSNMIKVINDICETIRGNDHIYTCSFDIYSENQILLEDYKQFFERYGYMFTCSPGYAKGITSIRVSWETPREIQTQNKNVLDDAISACPVAKDITTRNVASFLNEIYDYINSNAGVFEYTKMIYTNNTSLVTAISKLFRSNNYYVDTSVEKRYGQIYTKITVKWS